MIQSKRTVFGAGLVALSAIGFQTVASEAVDKPSGHNALGLAQTPLPAYAIGAPEGFVGVRWQANITGSLKGFDIDRHVRMVEDRKMRDWWWIGEQPGKWLEASVFSSTISGDPAFAAQVKGILARLVNAQAADGYLGISAPSVLTAAKPLRGMDPYEQYFMLHGLLTAWEVLGDPTALEAAKKLGSYYVDHIGPGKAEFWPSPLRPPENRNTIIVGQYTWVPPGTRKAAQAETDMFGHSEIAGHGAHYGWEGTLIADPILRLYQATGDKRYLDWAAWVVSRIDTWSGWDSFSRLDEVAAGKIGLHQLQPYVHSHTFQMNFLGFLRLYQITGDRSYLRKVEGAWRDIVSRQLYITGGVSVGEHYEPGYNRPVEGGVVETCANMSWMELNQYLLELTGEPKYAEVMERLLINHVFAAQTGDGDCYRYHTPPNGMKPEGFFHGPDCCTASGHRLTAKVPTFIYAQAKDTAIVNQYVPSSAAIDLGGGRKVTLKQETRYPEEETVSVQIDPATAGKFTLRLRIPAWCEQPVATLNGGVVGGVKSGTYLDITRVWKGGDRVTLTFPMTARWVEHDHLEASQARWALVRGPVVYAVDNLWWDVKDVASPRKVDQALALASGQRGRIKPVPAPAGLLGPAYRAELTASDGTVVEPLLVPFANVGVWYKDPAKKPERNSATYSYAVWLYAAETSAFKQMAEEQKVMAEALRNAIDLVRIGDAASEKAHQVQGESGAGGFRGRIFRHGKAFSYELKVATEAPSDLVVTYWGGEQNKRVFDVLANDRLLATQTLLQNKPGEFFEVRYALPFELIKGKTDALGQKVDKVTVKVQAHPGSTAGGVFGLRSEPTQKIVQGEQRFPYFLTDPVPYFAVRLEDSFWAPRQQLLHDVSVPWATRHFDASGGLDAYRKQPDGYHAKTRAGDAEATKFIEAMAAVVGLRRDGAIEGLVDAWGKNLINGQGKDGYLEFGYPHGASLTNRWVPVWSSHEDYVLGHYLEAGIGYLESTGNRTLYDSALQAVDNMTSVFLGNSRAYAPGHEEIEQALTRLYGMTGDPKYLNLCGWLIAQRGCHEGRPNYGLYSQDQIPVKDQRTIEGHAVRAAFLFNGVTEYVGATGNPDYRQAVLAVWNDFEKRKMYVHGAGGTFSGNNEGYTTKPYYIPPNECYGETCSVFGNFQWAHNLFRLTGEARYLDTAERMLYNAFYASLALSGDRFFYENPAEVRHPTPRGEWHGCPCCPPNIVKLLAKVGFFFYSTDKDGIYVKQYGASSADIPFAKGVKLTQRTGYPWNGEITIQVDPAEVCRFALRLRLPAWAKSHSLVVNGKSLSCSPERGWLTVTRDWKAGDVVKFSLPMEIERVSMSEAFNEYKGLVALQRGPIVYCLEGQDVAAPLRSLYIPADARFTAVHRPELLGGVTVLQGNLGQATAEGSKTIHAQLVPYGVWDNRTPGEMRIFLPFTEKRLPDREVECSMRFPAEMLDEISDGKIPVNSLGDGIGRFTWWDHKGTTEWIQYDFPAPRTISHAEVYWFDDTGQGGCRVPKSWRLLYKVDGEWKPVLGADEFGTKPDTFNAVTFTPVITDGLRLEVQLQPEFSAGILKWMVK